MWNIGPKEILIIAVLGLILFGGKKLSEMARNLGQTTKDFKNARKELNSALDETSASVKQTLTMTERSNQPADAALTDARKPDAPAVSSEPKSQETP